MAEEILRYEHVCIAYGGRTVVSDVSFSLPAGGILGIAGESGCGKSSLIRAAMGLLGSGGVVTDGAIVWRGRDITHLTERERQRVNGRQIGMIFQDAGNYFCPVRTIGAQLFEAARETERLNRQAARETERIAGRTAGQTPQDMEKFSRQAFRERALQFLAQLGFEEPARVWASYPFELSGGMQQRTGIAAAVLPGPELLLADEPTSALDGEAQRAVIEELRFLNRERGIAMIVVSHNIGVLYALADRLMIMQDGRVVEYGGTEQVIRRPREAYTRKLIDSVPALRE